MFIIFPELFDLCQDGKLFFGDTLFSPLFVYGGLLLSNQLIFRKNTTNFRIDPVLVGRKKYFNFRLSQLSSQERLIVANQRSTLEILGCREIEVAL